MTNVMIDDVCGVDGTMWVTLGIMFILYSNDKHSTQKGITGWWLEVVILPTEGVMLQLFSAEFFQVLIV